MLSINFKIIPNYFRSQFGICKLPFCTHDFSSGTLNKKARVAFLNTQILNNGQNLRIGVKGILPLQAVGGYPPTLLANNGKCPY
jgi:hypothetical protein